jgi:hypothetical protein
MAQILDVQLQITPDTDINFLNFTVEYDVVFTTFDIKSDLPYGKTYVVIGVDTPAAVTGPPADPAEAGGNDTLATVKFGSISAGGAKISHQKDVIRVARVTADEDKPPIPNPDELQVRVELTPFLPTNTARVSNIVKMNLP